MIGCVIQLLICIQNYTVYEAFYLKNIVDMKNEVHLIPSMLMIAITNLGSQFISLIFLARQQKIILVTTWQIWMRDVITVPVFPI